MSCMTAKGFRLVMPLHVAAWSLLLQASSALAFPPALRLPPTSAQGTYALGTPGSSDVLGAAIADGGDLNGDGRPDFMVSAMGPNETGDQVYAVFDAPSLVNGDRMDLSRINGVNGMRLDAPAVDLFGSALTHCDFDGDGIDDLVVGAPGSLVNNVSLGGVYVIYGSAIGFPAAIDVSALDPALGFRIDADSGVPGSRGVGASVACRGNTMTPGPQDLIIGAPETYNTDGSYGAVYVVSGRVDRPRGALSLSNLAAGSIVRISGTLGGSAYRGTGTSVAAVRDFNGDGQADFVFNCRPTDDVVACVVFGGAPLPAAMKVSELAPPIGTYIGAGTSGFSETVVVGSSTGIQRGTVGDILIGNWDANASGVVYAVFGRASGVDAPIELSDLDASTGWRVVATTSSFASALSLDASRDLDGDGAVDLLIGTSNSIGPIGRWSYVLSSRLRTGFSSDVSDLNAMTGMAICEESVSSGSMIAVEAGDVLGTGMPTMLAGLGSDDGFTGAVYVIKGIDRIFGSNFDTMPLTREQICQF
jgi:FG-GAP repeat protein